MEDLPNKISAILAHIAQNNAITVAKLSKQIGVTDRTIERNLKKLQEQNKLKRIGGVKSGHWKVLEPN